MIYKRFVDGISESEIYDYEDEQLLLIGDWYHRSAVDVQASYLTFRSSGNEVGSSAMLLLSPILTSYKACSGFPSGERTWIL